jgi:hypothetical protein
MAHILGQGLGAAAIAAMATVTIVTFFYKLLFCDLIRKFNVSLCSDMWTG